jgi:hypothetical protein
MYFFFRLVFPFVYTLLHKRSVTAITRLESTKKGIFTELVLIVKVMGMIGFRKLDLSTQFHVYLMTHLWELLKERLASYEKENDPKYLERGWKRGFWNEKADACRRALFNTHHAKISRATRKLTVHMIQPF